MAGPQPRASGRHASSRACSALPATGTAPRHCGQHLVAPDHPVSASTCWYPRGRASVITAFFVRRTVSRANSLGLSFGLEYPFKLPFFRE